MGVRVFLMIGVIVLLVVGAGCGGTQDQATVNAQQAVSGSNFQVLFSTLKTRMEADALYTFRIRHTALEGAVEISQAGTRLVEAAADYFCLANSDTERFCYPYSQLLVVAVPQ